MTIDELKAKCGGDRALARNAIASIAAATSSPKADLPALNAKLAALRGLLASCLPASALMGRVRAATAAAGLVVFGGAPTRQFEATGPGADFYWKEIVPVGRVKHPDTNEEFDFDAAYLSHIADESNRFLASIGRSPFPDEHKSAAADNLGWWYAYEFRPEDNALFGLIEVTNEKAKGKVGGDIRDVSIALSALERDVKGNEYRDVIVHVCATSYPVIPGMRNFEKVELSRGGVTAPIFRPASTPASTEEGTMKFSKEALALLGLAEDAKQEAIEAAIKEFSKRTPPAAPPAPATPPSGDPVMLSRVAELERQNAQFKKDAEARDTAELEQLVTSTKERVTAAGVPAAFSAERETSLRALWSRGEKAAAKEFAILAGESAGRTSSTLPAGAKPAPGGDGPRKEQERQRDRVDAMVGLAREQGRVIVFSSDRKKVTIHPLRSEIEQGAKPTEYDSMIPVSV